MNQPTSQPLVETLHALHARATHISFTVHIGRRVDVHAEGFLLFDHDGARMTRQPVSAEVAADLLTSL
jgi:hypothetical protein